MPRPLTPIEGLKVDDTDTVRTYHGKPARADKYPPERRKFIAWDGEGINRDGIGRPQAYVLFGCSTGDYISSNTHLHTFDLLDLILKVGKENPDAWHVGFAFNYDANMIVQSLSQPACESLHKHGRVTLNRAAIGKYHIQFRPSKWFSVTRYGLNYDRKRNPHDKTTVRIYDLFGFFAKSFVTAYEELVGPIPSVVREGKEQRGSFSTQDNAYILTYWQAEIRLLQDLAEELRRRLYGAGLRITQWHGPGALASYALRQNGIKQHMAECPDEVREAARYAYAGGRFEMFKLGRTQGPIYSVDINSAYPYGITQLPSLANGVWQRATLPMRRIAKFGVYRVRLNPRFSGSFIERAPGPLFHRDSLGNISFPWVLDGWYWSPEVRNLVRLDAGRYSIVDGWEYVGGRVPGEPLPFAWVADMYEKRREWKRAGLGSQLALKLCMNSLYGKMAQRVGWDEEKRRAPAWHQLEWAGWVTSNTRAMLWDLLSRIPFSRILAVETDGLYTTMSPGELGIQDSSELGGWEVTTYDEILYVQSGMAWLRKGNTWTCKRRGLDARTFGLSECETYLKSLSPRTQWEPYTGSTTRFIGLGAALNSNAPFKLRHCVWSIIDREIRPGQGGKRVHIHGQCRACEASLSAWDGAHDMSIRSLALANPMSYPHDIPWEDSQESYLWREIAEQESWYVSDSEALVRA